ncbi:MAG: STAS domain-containing protein [Burkholderiales bacterium]|nr:STAS domain-containing protein [Phycisphaerae bacterium]
MHAPQLPRFSIVPLTGANVVELVLPANIEAIEFDSINEQLSAVVVSSGEARWIVDLSGAEYFGSALLGMLVNLRAKVRASRGKLALCQIGPALERVIKTSSMERLFTIVVTRDEALASF